MIKRVTIDIGKDEEIKDSENFQDIRMEMNSVGLNLVSTNFFRRASLILCIDFSVNEPTRDIV